MYKSTRARTTALPLQIATPYLSVWNPKYCETHEEFLGCTWLKNKAKWASSTASSTLASSHTMKGDFPPSSKVTGLRLLLAANWSTIFPVWVDPVKASCQGSAFTLIRVFKKKYVSSFLSEWIKYQIGKQWFPYRRSTLLWMEELNLVISRN